MDYELLRAEHKHLDLVIDRLKLVAAARPGIIAEHRWCDLLIHELESLQIALQQHFANEDEGGYFHDATAERPELAARVEALHAQHQQIQADIEGLIPAIADASNPRLLAGRVRHMLGVFEGHERGENELVQTVYLRDTPAAD